MRSKPLWSNFPLHRHSQRPSQIGTMSVVLVITRLLPNLTRLTTKISHHKCYVHLCVCTYTAVQVRRSGVSSPGLRVSHRAEIQVSRLGGMPIHILPSCQSINVIQDPK